MVQVVAAQEIHDARAVGQLEAEGVREHARSGLAVPRVEHHVRHPDRAAALIRKRGGRRLALGDEPVRLSLGTGDVEARAAAGLVELVDPRAMLQSGLPYPVPRRLDFRAGADEGRGPEGAGRSLGDGNDVAERRRSAQVGRVIARPGIDESPGALEKLDRGRAVRHLQFNTA